MASEPDESLEFIVGRLLTEQSKTIAIAESCTGGLLTHRLTNVPGSSSYLIASVIAYAYQAKVAALGVTWETLDTYGAVSAETAVAMAEGARRRFECTLGLAITGIAGPGGGTPDKPVGLTFIALVDESHRIVERYTWSGNRVENKQASAQAALARLVKYLETGA